MIDVAAEAGFGSLGHFNQVFRVAQREHAQRLPRRGAATRRAAPGAPAQPPEPGGGALACGRADERDARPSLRSSCFTIESTQAERGTLPS